jgi:hypothetical protein
MSITTHNWDGKSIIPALDVHDPPVHPLPMTVPIEPPLPDNVELVDRLQWLEDLINGLADVQRHTNKRLVKDTFPL